MSTDEDDYDLDEVAAQMEAVDDLVLRGIPSDFDLDGADFGYLRIVAKERNGLTTKESEMQVERIDSMFNFTFEKSSTEIIEKSKAKVVAIKAKIEERGKRITATRTEYKITDAVLIDLLQQARAAQGRHVMSYTSNASVKSGNGLTEETVTVGAGVVNMLLTEQDFIDGEKAQVSKLEVIIRNLADLPDAQGRVRGHKLSFGELTFLGF